jgi:glycosidase
VTLQNAQPPEQVQAAFDDAAKEPYSDIPLRPALDLMALRGHSPQPELFGVIQKLAALRKQSPALLLGDYQEALVRPNQLAFYRRADGDQVLIVLNSAEQAVDLELEHLPWGTGRLQDRLNPGEAFQIENGRLRLSVPPTWGRILQFER